MCKIYVASLSDYNAGRLHGKWVDLDDCLYDSDTVLEEITNMLQESKEMIAEEYAIHDYDGFPCNITSQLGEYPDLELVCNLAEKIDQDEDMIEALMNCTGDLSYLENIEDHSIYKFDDRKDVQWFLFELHFGDLDQSVQDRIESYIDLDGLWHEYITIGEFNCEYINGTYYLIQFN